MKPEKLIGLAERVETGEDADVEISDLLDVYVSLVARATTGSIDAAVALLEETCHEQTLWSVKLRNDGLYEAIVGMWIGVASTAAAALVAATLRELAEKEEG